MTKDPTGLLAAAKSLAPLIREHAAEGDANRCVSPSVVRAMAEAGLFRMTIAASCGGFEADALTQYLVTEEVSRADGGTGWTLMISGETGGIASGCMHPDTAREIFGENPLAVFAGALNPLGRGVRVEGGYRVTGQWPFASACHHAHFFWGQFVVYDGDQPAAGPGGRPILREALIPRRDFEVIDTWQVGGMRGSGSADVAATDAFVPERYTTAAQAGPVGQDGVLFRFPLYSRLAYNKAAVSTGIARAALDDFIDLASNKIPRGSTKLLREREMVQRAIADAEATLRSARAWMLECVREMWEDVERGRTIGTAQRALLQLASTHACAASEHAVEIVYKAAGVTANYQSSLLERCMRDIHVVPAHIMVSPVWYEPTGRVLLGMESRSFML